MVVNSKKTPKGRLVEVDGIKYQLIEGKLYRYADLTLDKGFKIVLGRIGSEDVLKNMLNCLLGERIKKLEYRNTEHPGMTEEEQMSRFDVYCEDEDGRAFQVEMQNWKQKYFNKRAVYYSSLVMQDQTVKARKKSKKWDYDYHPLYVVSFLNFQNWTSASKDSRLNPYISTYRFLDAETKEELGDGTNLVFVNLFDFNKNEYECESLEDFWMYSIKNMFDLERCPEVLKGTEIEELYIRSELAMMTTEQRIKYEEDVMTNDDILNSIAEQIEEAREEAIAQGLSEGRAKGRAEGRAEGRVEGRAEGRAEVIRKMLNKGMTADDVCSLLEISPSGLNEILA